MSNWQPVGFTSAGGRIYSKGWWSALVDEGIKQTPLGCQCGCGECELSYAVDPRSTMDMLGETDEE